MELLGSALPTGEQPPALDESGGDLVFTPGAAGHPSRRVSQHRRLRDAIKRFLDGWNEQAHPFAWTKTADQILDKANREAISASVH